MDHKNEFYNEDDAFVSKSGKIALNVAHKLCSEEIMDDSDIKCIRNQNREIIDKIKENELESKRQFDILMQVLLYNKISILEDEVSKQQLKLDKIESEINGINDKIAYILGRIISIDSRI